MAVARGTTTATLKSWNVFVTVAGATNLNNINVIARNRRTGEYRIYQTDGNAEVVVNAADLTTNGTDDGTHTGFQVDDVIEFKMDADAVGHAVTTVNAGTGGSTVAITGVDFTSSTTPGRTY